MAEAAYRDDQWARRYDAHVEPLNRLIDEFGRHDTDGPPPSHCADVPRRSRPRACGAARPGPKAGGAKGSGFLSVENDDPTAERELSFFVEAGLDPADFIPWNAYPCYINAAPTTAQLRAGTDPLRQVLNLLPAVRVVLLQGGHAHRGWRYYLPQANRHVVGERGIHVFATYHPGRQALWHPDPGEKPAVSAET